MAPECHLLGSEVQSANKQTENKCKEQGTNLQENGAESGKYLESANFPPPQDLNDNQLILSTLRQNSFPEKDKAEVIADQRR